VSKSRIVEKSAEAVERSRMMKLEEANGQLRAEHDEARSKVAELEGHENILKSSYGSLREDYGNLETLLAAA
jgi:hypothetical protein